MILQGLGPAVGGIGVVVEMDLVDACVDGLDER